MSLRRHHRFFIATTTGRLLPLGAAFVLAAACGDDSAGDTSATTTDSTSTTTAGTAGTTGTTAGTTTATGSGGESDSDSAGTTATVTTSATDPTAATTTDSATDPSTSSDSDTDPITSTTDDTTTGGGGCGLCNQPNQSCVDDVCVTTCQGQQPDPCGPDQVCDVISGECKAEGDACVLAGGYQACEAKTCGPGSVCDGVGECVPIAPCAGVDCTDQGECWGSLCSCTRTIECDEPSAALLNGPFSTDIGGLDFADDCNAYMVTLRSGPDYVRRITPDGTLTTWTGVANLNMGEVRVLKRLTVPQATQKDKPLAGQIPPPPQKIEGFGEVAITYTCCPTCGCQANPPQGVARLDEQNMQNPLPIIIVAKATQGNGPFGNTAADAGPHGLTWGEDRVLYVGNSTDNGDWNTADLDKATQAKVLTFPVRVTAAAPVSPAHILVGLIGGEVHTYNVNTQTTEFLVDLGQDITSLSHDSFTGLVYAGLRDLEIVELHPFTGDVITFGTMPGKGRVAVSPSGKLWFTPVKILNNLPLSSWPLPNSF